MLALPRRLVEGTQMLLRDRAWAGWSPTSMLGHRLRGKALGIVGMGLAAYSSWTINASVGWACVHAMFGWLYMLYLCGGCGGGLPPGVF